MDTIPETLSERNKELLYKYWAGVLTTEEHRELDASQDPDIAYLKQLLDDKQFVNNYITTLQEAEANLERNKQAARVAIEAQHPKTAKIIRMNARQFRRIAAVLVAVTAAAVWFFTRDHGQAAEQPPIAGKTSPGINRATLSLAIGQRFILNEMANGKIWTNGASTIFKQDGMLKLIVDSTSAKEILDNPSISNHDPSIIRYDTLETPRGGQFAITMPDGSHIQLNAASRLIFPSAFDSDHRQAQIIGEALFIIQHNPNKPFIVRLPNNISLDVLGTQFNISAYPDDNCIQTTLLTGRLHVKNERQNQYLEHDNQQLVISNTGIWQLRDNIDPKTATAWTSNEFNFDGDSLSHALRQIARWYDMDIVRKEAIKETTLHGTQSREKPLQNLLKTISTNTEDTFFHYKLEGRNILVRR